MTVATIASSPMPPLAALPAVSTARIIMWTVLFQIAWFWKKLPLLMSEGAMPDTDDFQRLAQVRNWMNGQGWFDLVNHSMNPPSGADIHWSRLVDVPIAMLIRLFELGLSPVLAERAAAIVWPMLLLVATVLVVLAICRKLDPAANPLLALLFTVTCITALTEFMPGRIDHHGVQILLFCLMLLGIVSGKTGFGPVLVGIAIVASISVGLDAIMIVAFLFGWLGLDWVIGRDPDGAGLKRVAAGLAIATPVLFLANIAPQDWAQARCDANSSFYLLALLLVAAAYATLGQFSPVLASAGSSNRMIAIRFAAGSAAGIAVVAALLLVYPHCAAGPFSQLPPELQTRWLVNVGEARGLLGQLKTVPQIWFWGVFYSTLMVAVAAFVTLRRYRTHPEIIALFAVLGISVVASLIQYRALRIGIFAAIPFCVLFAEMAFVLFSRAGLSRITSGVLKAAVVLLLASPTWLAMGLVAFPPNAGESPKSGPLQTAGDTRDWRAQQPHIFCNKQSEYAQLASLAPGLVMSDIDSGPAMLVFTAHTVVGGPYHRNDRAILDIIDFFETDTAKALQVAQSRKIAYVAYCEDVKPLEEKLKDSTALAAMILQGKEPTWLQRISQPNARMHLFKVQTAR